MVLERKNKLIVFSRCPLVGYDSSTNQRRCNPFVSDNFLSLEAAAAAFCTMYEAISSSVQMKST